MKPLISDKNRRILSYLKDGSTMKEVAKIIGVSRERIRQIAHKFGHMYLIKKEREQRFFQLLKLYNSGMTISDFRRKYPEMIYKLVSYLKRNNLYVTKAESIRKRNVLIVKLYKKGYSNKEIAERVNLNKHTASNYIRHLGFYKRGVGKKSEERS